MSRYPAWLAGPAAAVALIVLVILILVSFHSELGLLDGDGGPMSHVAIFALIAGDAIIPLLPGETALNAVLATDGVLELWLVVLMGSLGAVVGDSALYWIARTGGDRFSKQFERAKTNQRVSQASELLGKRAPFRWSSGGTSQESAGPLSC